MSDVRRISEPNVEEADDPVQDQAVERHMVSNHNRWSRTIFTFKDLPGDTWCELGFQIHWNPDEESRSVHDFAVIGFDFQTEDGSSIDFGYVPGLTRTQIDPHSFYVGGPDYHGRSSDLIRSGRVQCAFLVPRPATQVAIAIRSWRNSHPFEIDHVKLRQFPQGRADAEQDPSTREDRLSVRRASRRSWKSISSNPTWLSYAVLPGRPLIVRGQLINEGKAADGALARIVFRNAAGEELPLPYDDIPVAPAVGAFIDIPAHRQTRRFTLELTPPPAAARVELGFQLWRPGATMELVTPLEVSLGEDLLIENISGEGFLDAPGFMDELLKRLGAVQPLGAGKEGETLSNIWIDRDALASPSTIHDRLRFVQHGETKVLTEDQVSLCGFPAWTLPQNPEWTEDPFQSPAWRLEFQSLIWLLDLARSQEPKDVARAIDLALSWSQANPSGAPKDALSAYPLSMAVRAEVLLQLLSLGMAAKKPIPPAQQQSLLAEVVRHATALAEIVSQNLFSHSLLQIQVASALLALSRAIPRFPLAPYWMSVALAHLNDGFDQMIDPSGSFAQQSQHDRLELVSIGLILIESLQSRPETQTFRDRMTARLKAALQASIAITDPSGMLPPFGDMPRNHHHAPWLRRLISGYGRTFLLDRGFAEELAYPTGGRLFASDSSGVVTARHYEQKPDWGYLCASFTEQRHDGGHFDCSTFVYSAAGMRWITDPGGSSLSDAGPARQYLISSRAHNVAIPDGREQSSGRGWLEASVSLENAHVFRIGTNVHGPDYAHSRTFVCLKDLNAVAVFDRFTAGQGSILFEGFLHFDEDIAVALASAKLAIGFRDEDRLRIVPYGIAGQFSGLGVENGRNDRAGMLQGFLTHRAGGLQPSNVLRYRFSGHAEVCGGVVLAISRNAFGKLDDLLGSPDVRRLIMER